MSSAQKQVNELIASGFSKEEALQALNISNNDNTQTIAVNLADYMQQIESDMLKMNQSSNEYNQSIERKLKEIHNHSLYLQQLIQKKEKQLIDKIENKRDMLKSKLIEKKQTYIHLSSELQNIKQSLDDTNHKQNDTCHKLMDSLSTIKLQMDANKRDNAQLLVFFDMNHWSINHYWNKIEENINASDFMHDTEDKKSENNDNDDILSIDVMTYNLRNSLLDTKWSQLWSENRRKLTADMLHACGPPAVIATQEGVINQLIDIQCDLPSNYVSVGDGRLHKKWYNSSNDRMNEHCKIFWNNDILQVVDYGTFQLKKPQDAPLPRVVTWCLYDFNSKYNIKYALFVVNTHLSYKTEKIRIVQTQHLMEFVVEIMKDYKSLYPPLYHKELLIVIMGDFNSVSKRGSQLYDYLFDNEIDECVVDGIKIVDSFADCTQYCNLNCSFTYHGYNGIQCKHKSNFIDWILCSKNIINSDAISLKCIKVITEHEFSAGLPSDHYPVVVTFDIQTEKCQTDAQKDCLLQ